MSSLAAPPAGRLHRRRRARARAATPTSVPAGATQIRPPQAPKRAVDLDTISADWRLALDAAEESFRAVNGIGKRLGFTPAELGTVGDGLRDQRRAVAQLLDACAREQHLQLRRPLSAPRATRRLLGLPSTVDACIFALEGVLTGSAAVHAAAWEETFDELLSRRVERVGERFAPYRPFDAHRDYASYLHGRPRLDGVHAFLASRGIRLPRGSPTDPPGAETVHGLANRKNEALVHRLEREGVHAYAGARAYLEAAREAGLPCAVVSASAHSTTILERAGLDDLVAVQIDGDVIAAGSLRPAPAPDTILAACSRLGVEPRHVAVFETMAAGIEAARAAGAGLAVGVDHSGLAADLRATGPDLVVTDLAALAQPGLTA